VPAIQHRYDFVYLFDVTDGNPNGDPDAGNQPRIDPETGEGLVTDVCLKRKVRNAVQVFKGDQTPFEIYFQTQDAPTHLRILNRQHQRALDAVTSTAATPTADAEPPADAEAKKGGKKGGKKTADKGQEKSADVTANARRWMCDNFWDVRTFGAVMTTGVNCGQVRGPVQFTFARSVGPVLSLEHAITRKSVTTDEAADKQAKGDGSITGTMGRKMTIPYALYACRGFVSAHLAEQTGFADADLDLLWSSLIRMFEFDRSATRGQMSARGLYVFKHASKLGNAASHKLQERIKAERKDKAKPPRSFDDFAVTVAADPLPNGVELLQFDCTQFADTPILITPSR